MNKKQVHFNSYISAFVSVIVFVLLDQYTKLLAVSHLKEKSIEVIKGVFQLHYLENRGAAFGMLQNQQTFFLIISIVVLTVIGVLYVKIPHTKHFTLLRICLVLITSGAIGNLIDRVRFNYVVDFLYFELIDFPIFNVADIYVTVSTFALVLLMIFYYKDEDIECIYAQLSLKRKKEKEQE